MPSKPHSSRKISVRELVCGARQAIDIMIGIHHAHRPGLLYRHFKGYQRVVAQLPLPICTGASLAHLLNAMPRVSRVAPIPSLVTDCSPMKVAAMRPVNNRLRMLLPRVHLHQRPDQGLDSALNAPLVILLFPDRIVHLFDELYIPSTRHSDRLRKDSGTVNLSPLLSLHGRLLARRRVSSLR